MYKLNICLVTNLYSNLISLNFENFLENKWFDVNSGESFMWMNPDPMGDPTNPPSGSNPFNNLPNNNPEGTHLQVYLSSGSDDQSNYTSNYTILILY